MIWILLIGVAIFVFKAFMFRDKVLTQQVDAHGGMQNKYSELIKGILSGDERARIIRSSRDEIVIYVQGNYGVSTTFKIKEAPGTTHIFWECDWVQNGKHKNEFRFPDTLSQNVMLSEIQIYMQNKFSF